MSKSEELHTISKIVKQILEKEPQTRNSDMALYVKVCEKINHSALDYEFWYVCLNLKQFNLPCFETVRRARQKVQAEYSELAATSNVEAQRELNEEAFKNYARGAV